MARALILCLMLGACSPVVTGGGCMVYGEARQDMPSPEGAPLDFLRWFNATDAGMLAACR